MTISPVALAAKKVIDAAWLHGDAYDLASQAAFALESAQLLMSPETAAELERLRSENELLRTIHDQQQTAMVQMSTELGQAQRDAAEDLPRLRANLRGWSERGRKAEAELKSALIRVAEMEARSVAAPDTDWWLAQYEGVEPELFVTEAAAREFCDDQAAGDVDCWDWFPDGDRAWRQVRTSDLDDRPLGDAPGLVTRVTARSGVLADGITRRFAPTQALRDDDVTPQVRKLRNLLAGQRAAAEDDPYGLHHAYRVGRDLPETGGAL